MAHVRNPQQNSMKIQVKNSVHHAAPLERAKTLRKQSQTTCNNSLRILMRTDSLFTQNIALFHPLRPQTHLTKKNAQISIFFRKLADITTCCQVSETVVGHRKPVENIVI